MQAQGSMNHSRQPLRQRTTTQLAPSYEWRSRGSCLHVQRWPLNSELNNTLKHRQVSWRTVVGRPFSPPASQLFLIAQLPTNERMRCSQLVDPVGGSHTGKEHAQRRRKIAIKGFQGLRVDKRTQSSLSLRSESLRLHGLAYRLGRFRAVVEERW
jgi:hypothetical protein